MAYDIIGIDGALMRIRIRGLLRLQDQTAMQGVARELIERGIRPRLLVIAEDFAGWEKTEAWGDVGFLMDYGDAVEKIAIVGAERWKEQALLFVGQGLRATEIRYFPPSALAEAEDWARA